MLDSLTKIARKCNLALYATDVEDTCINFDEQKILINKNQIDNMFNIKNEVEDIKDMYYHFALFHELNHATQPVPFSSLKKELRKSFKDYHMEKGFIFACEIYANSRAIEMWLDYYDNNISSIKFRLLKNILKNVVYTTSEDKIVEGRSDYLTTLLKTRLTRSKGVLKYIKELERHDTRHIFEVDSVIDDNTEILPMAKIIGERIKNNNNNDNQNNNDDNNTNYKTKEIKDMGKDEVKKKIKQIIKNAESNKGNKNSKDSLSRKKIRNNIKEIKRELTPDIIHSNATRVGTLANSLSFFDKLVSNEKKRLEPLTFMKRNRRLPSLPGKIRETSKDALFLDVSGSMLEFGIKLTIDNLAQFRSVYVFAERCIKITEETTEYLHNDDLNLLVGCGTTIDTIEEFIKKEIVKGTIWIISDFQDGDPKKWIKKFSKKGIKTFQVI